MLATTPTPLRLATMLALAALAFATPAVAQSARIAVFDPNAILTGSRLGQQLQDDLNAFRVQREAEIKKESDALKRLMEQYQAGLDTMSAERRETIETDLLQRKRDLERNAKDAEMELGRRRQKAVRQLEEQVQVVIRDYGTENNYTLILQRDLVAYAPDAIDISDAIIQRIDARTN